MVIVHALSACVHTAWYDMASYSLEGVKTFAFRTSAGMGTLQWTGGVCVWQFCMHTGPVAGIVPSHPVSPLDHPITLQVIECGVAFLHPKGIQCVKV